MCLAQGPQHSDGGEARTAALRSRVKHSTTEPLRSLHTQRKAKYYKSKKADTHVKPNTIKVRQQTHA